MTKLHFGLVIAIVAAGVAGYVVQMERQATLRGEAEALREQLRQLAALKRQNLELARTAAEVEELKKDTAVLPHLREELAALQAKVQTQAVVRPTAAPPPLDISGQVFPLATLDRPPAARRSVRPEYPAELREAGVSGQVVLSFVSGADGNVDGVTVVKSTHPALEAAAVAAIAQWGFEPGQKDGKAVKVGMQIPIVFSPPRTGAPPANAAPNGGTPKKERLPVPGWF